MASWLVGLTGGIGSGKSAAADRFVELGINIVDADIASRAVVEPGTPALSTITERFGETILQEDGSLDRAQLRHIVFADDTQRGWLQQLLHPQINRYLKTHIKQATSTYVVLVNPLLIETRQASWCDRVVVIDVPEALQLERTMRRDQNTQSQVENIMRAQMGREARLAVADDVITNEADLAHLYRQIDQLHNKYLTECQTQPA